MLKQGIRSLSRCHRNHLPTTSVLWNPVAPLSTVSESEDDKHLKHKSLFDQCFGKGSCEAKPGFKNRWLMAIPAFATNMCIGSPWAWSIMGDIITKEVGFVAPVAADWSLAQSCLPLSIVFVVLGGSAAALGPWQSRVGHRKSLFAAALTFGGGLAIGSAGIHLHSLPLLYAGYGALAGLGLGLSYTPCIATLMQWFPDRKGTASGITVAGFGSGALLFTPLVQNLTIFFAKMPEYVGPTEDFVLRNVNGCMFTDVNGSAVEVVEAIAYDIAKLSYALPEGLYIVGSGSTGASEALGVCAIGYFTVMLASALALRTPHSSYIPDQITSSNSVVIAKSGIPVASVKDISMPEAIRYNICTRYCVLHTSLFFISRRSPQFHLLGITFTCLAMGGMGIFSVAKPMMSEVSHSFYCCVVSLS